MADDVVLNLMSGGALISTEDIGGGLQMPRTKIALGAHGTEGGDVTTGNPFPVAIQGSSTLSVANFPTVQPVNGTVSTLILAGSTVSVANLPTVQPVSGTVSVANFPGTQVVSGTVSSLILGGSSTVSVSNLPAVQPVNGTVSALVLAGSSVSVANFPTIQPVSGTISVANLPATQPVSGTVNAVILGGSSTVSVANFPAVQPVNGTVNTILLAGSTVSVANFPASQPVSGTVSVANLPVTQPVNGTVSALVLAGASVAVNNFPATQPVNGTVNAILLSSSTVSVANFPGTQPVNGTVALSTSTATIGVISSAAQGATGSAVPAQAILQGVSDGTNLQGRRTSNVFNSAAASSVGNTAVWTPASGKKFRLLAYCLEVTANSSVTGGGLVSMTIKDSGTAVGLFTSVFLPAAAGTIFAPSYNSGWRILGNGILSSSINNVLNIGLGAAFASGQAVLTVAGTEE